MKYLERIQIAPEEALSSNVELTNDNAKLACEEAIIDEKKRINSLKQESDDAKCSIPFIPTVVIDVGIKLAVAQKRLTALRNLQKELF